MFNAFWTDGHSFGGGDKRLLEIFRRIGSSFTLGVMTSKEGRKFLEKVLPDAVFHVYPRTQEEQGIIGAYISRTFWAIKVVFGQDYDCLYASSDFFPDVIPCYLYKGKHHLSRWVQCVFHIYPSWLVRPGNKVRNIIGSLSQSLSFMLIKRRADAVITLNENVSNCLVSDGVSKNVMHVNPCGVDTVYFTSIPLNEIRYDGCFLGRLVPSKGILDLVKIWGEVVRVLPNAKLAVIGGGDESFAKQVKDEVANARLADNIAVKGFLSEREAFGILKSSKVFLFPSHEEGFGMSVVEAMACAVPVVAWDLPVYREVFSNGLISVEKGNISLFGQKVVEILKDDRIALEVGRTSKQMAGMYDWAKVAEEELKIIRQRD